MQSASKIRLGLGQLEVRVGRVRVGRETPQTSSNTWQTPCFCWMTSTLLSMLCLIRSMNSDRSVTVTRALQRKITGCDISTNWRHHWQIYVHRNDVELSPMKTWKVVVPTN